MCRELLQQQVQPDQITAVVFTEQRMRSHAERLAVARVEAEHRKKQPRHLASADGGAESSSDGVRPRANGREGQQHVRHIAARNQQQQSDGAEQSVEDGPESPYDPVDDGDDRDRESLRIPIRIELGKPARNRIELAIRLR